MKTVQSINLRFWDRVFCQNSFRFRVGFLMLRKVSKFIEKIMKNPFEKGLALTEKRRPFRGAVSNAFALL